MSSPIAALRNGGDEWLEIFESGQPITFEGADLRGCSLDDRVYPTTISFDGATFSYIALANAQFKRSASFHKAKFHQFADIRPQVSSGEALDFSEAEFFGLVDIDGRQSPDLVLVFNRTKFHKVVTILYGAKTGKFDFSGAEFYSDVIVKHENGELVFAGAKFGTAESIKASFRGATLHKGADFSHACFLGPADFENVTFGSSSSFVECTFHEAPNFHDAELHQGTRFSPQDQFPRLFRDTRSPGASNAYRTLKLAMNAQHALSEELGFFLLEMRSAEHNQKPWVKPLYRMYDLISLYGLSVKRPLLFFVAVNVVVGLLYSWLAGRGWGAWDPELVALTLYGAIPFAPALRSQVPETGSLFPSDVQAIVPVVVAVQGLLNAALLFLVLLGMRNMFKIK